LCDFRLPLQRRLELCPYWILRDKVRDTQTLKGQFIILKWQYLLHLFIDTVPFNNSQHRL
jgi:hypothetical protein